MDSSDCVINDEVFEVAIDKVKIGPFLLSVEESCLLFFDDLHGVVIVLDNEMRGFIGMGV